MSYSLANRTAWLMGSASHLAIVSLEFQRRARQRAQLERAIVRSRSGGKSSVVAFDMEARDGM